MELKELEAKLRYQGMEQKEMDFFWGLYGLSHQMFEGKVAREICHHGVFGTNTDFPIEHTSLTFFDEKDKKIFDLFLESNHFTLRYDLVDGSSYDVIIGLEEQDKIPTYSYIKYYSKDKPANYHEIVKPTKSRFRKNKESDPIHIEDYFDLRNLDELLYKKKRGCLSRVKTLFEGSR